MINKKISFIAIAVLLIALALAACSQKAEAPATTEKPAEKTEEKPAATADVKYQYYTAEQLKTAIENKDAMYILDIQPKDAYNEHHIVGAIPTYAFPADTDELRENFNSVIEDLKAIKDPIIIVCPGGGKGAQNTHAYLLEKGIPAEQMFILEKGQKGWPYEDLLEK